MNARLYDPLLGRMLSPDNFVGSGSQGFNRYSYANNNPLKYTDPSGNFAWLAIPIAAAIFGVGNLAAKAINGEINNFGDGLRAFGSGALAGAVLATGVVAGLGVPVLGTIIKGTGLLYAGITTLNVAASTVWGLTGDWSKLGNYGRQFLGNFYLDGNQSFLGETFQGISRFSWEVIQTAVGNSVAQFSNIVGKISSVQYFGGATFSRSTWNGGSISLGHNILLQDNDDQANITVGPGGYTFMHEYGHYLQSQSNGFSYLFKYGIPSAFKNREWTERDANFRAAGYFNNFNGYNWRENFYPVGTARHIYSAFNECRCTTNTQWWEYPVFPFSFLWN